MCIASAPRGLGKKAFYIYFEVPDARALGSCCLSEQGVDMPVEKIRGILLQHGRLSVPVDQIADDGDLYKAGLTSLATVGLMLALEDQFNVEFPDSLLSRKTFSSIDAILEAIAQLQK